jgi:hypothetical protein
MSFLELGLWRKFPAIYFGPELSPIVIFSALLGLCILSRRKNKGKKCLSQKLGFWRKFLRVGVSSFKGKTSFQVFQL